MSNEGMTREQALKIVKALRPLVRSLQLQALVKRTPMSDLIQLDEAIAALSQPCETCRGRKPKASFLGYCRKDGLEAASDGKPWKGTLVEQVAGLGYDQSVHVLIFPAEEKAEPDG